MKSVFVINSVPYNSGDLALLEALIYFFESNSIKVSAASDSPKFLEQIAEVEQSILDLHKVEHSRIMNYVSYGLEKFCGINLDLHILKNPFLSIRKKKKYFQTALQADAIVSAPGGYLNDHYSITERLLVFDSLLKKNAKLYLIGQSYGPFEKKESIESIKKLFNKCSIVLSRESFSFARVNKLGSFKSAICPDIAFLLHKKLKLFKVKKTTKVKRVAVSFRPWKSDALNSITIEKASALCNYLIDELHFEITFISTCQGIADYIDDSKFCGEILCKITNKSKFVINKEYHRPEELIGAYQNFDLYIGMRMHGAILSMLGGTLAINIAYEEKSHGLYKDLNIKELCLDLSNSSQEWITAIEKILKNFAMYENKLEEIVEQSSNQVFSKLENIFID